MSKLDEIARIIASDDDGCARRAEDSVPCVDAACCECYQLARKIQSCLREPSEAMKQAGRDKPIPTVSEIWRAMIDAMGE